MRCDVLSELLAPPYGDWLTARVRHTSISSSVFAAAQAPCSAAAAAAVTSHQSSADTTRRHIDPPRRPVCLSVIFGSLWMYLLLTVVSLVVTTV